MATYYGNIFSAMANDNYFDTPEIREQV